MKVLIGVAAMGIAAAVTSPGPGQKSPQPPVPTPKPVVKRVQRDKIFDLQAKVNPFDVVGEGQLHLLPVAGVRPEFLAARRSQRQSELDALSGKHRGAESDSRQGGFRPAFPDIELPQDPVQLSQPVPVPMNPDESNSAFLPVMSRIPR